MGIQLSHGIYPSCLFECSLDQKFPYLGQLITLIYRWSHPALGKHAHWVGGGGFSQIPSGIHRRCESPKHAVPGFDSFRGIP